jgi:hypothetical protein
VAFQARVSDDPVTEGVFLFDLPTTVEIDQTRDPDVGGSRVAINDYSEIAFHVEQPGDGTATIYRTDGVTTIDVADTSGMFAGFDSPGSINDAGEIAFAATLDSGDIGVFVQSGSSIDEIFGTPGDNGAVIYHPAINNASAVAFGFSIFEDPLTGVSSSISYDSILVSPGPREVIRTGIPLSGDFVRSLDFFGAMNDVGEISFRAELEDGRAGVYKAVPVPEPRAALVVAAALLTLAALRRQRALRRVS